MMPSEKKQSLSVAVAKKTTRRERMCIISMFPFRVWYAKYLIAFNAAAACCSVHFFNIKIFFCHCITFVSPIINHEYQLKATASC